LIGVALGKHTKESKAILEGHGYKIESPSDMADAASDLIVKGGDKWTTFYQQIRPMLEKTIGEKLKEDNGEESNASADPVSAIATAVGNIVGGITGVMASAKQRDAAKEGARGELYKGMLGVIQEKEKRKSAKQNQIIWAVVGLVVIVIVVVIAYVIMNKKKAAK
jgi:hypothetical protein